jgi:hypothetical protein
VILEIRNTLRKHFLVITAKKTAESKELVTMGDSVVKRNGIYLTESNAMGHLKSHPLQLTYDGGFREIKEQEVFKEFTSLPSHLRSGGSVFFVLNFLV